VCFLDSRVAGGDTPAPFLSITYGHNTHSTDIVTELTQLRARAVAGMYRVCHGVSAERTRRRARVWM